MLLLLDSGRIATPTGIAAPGPLLFLDLRVCRVSAVLGVPVVLADSSSAARMTAMSSWLAMYRAQMVNWCAPFIEVGGTTTGLQRV